jgi:hypothetical protein
MKKMWNTPQLVVLVSGKPEEAVLTACKSSQAQGGAPLLNQSVCTRSPGGSSLAVPCYACEALVLS